MNRLQTLGYKMKLRIIGLSAIIAIAMIMIFHALNKSENKSTEQSTKELKQKKEISVTSNSRESNLDQKMTFSAKKNEYENIESITDEEISRSMYHFTDADFHQLEEYKRTKGYFTPEDFAAYESYDIEALEALVKEHDLQAVHTLARRYEQQEAFARATELYKHAVILGSTNALRDLASQEELRQETYSWRTSTSEDIEEQKTKGALAILPFYEVGKLQGDRDLQHDINHFIRYHKIHLTDNDQQEIDRSAQLLYEEINSTREIMGLPELKIEVPESVEYFYEITLKYSSTEQVD